MSLPVISKKESERVKGIWNKQADLQEDIKNCQLWEASVYVHVPNDLAPRIKREADEMSLQMASDLNSAIMKWHKEKNGPNTVCKYNKDKGLPTSRHFTRVI